MMNIKNRYISYFKQDPARLITRLATAWLFVSELYLIFNPEPFNSLSFFSKNGFGLFLLFVLIGFAALCAVRNEKAVNLTITAAVFSYCIAAVSEYSDIYFMLGCSVIIASVVHFSKISYIKLSLSVKTLWAAGILLMLLFTFAVGSVCCLKYKNYWTPCYDFGIFSQMFEYMKETGLPLTTCERDGLLSHFAVHFSPIFYLLLPFYILMPSPVTLLVGQCLIAASGVIPLILICGNHRLSNLSAAAFSLCYTLYPAFAGGCGYYLHENNFLAPLVLWLIYFFEKNRAVPIFIFGLLTLSVKEDAAVYTSVIALYFIFARKNYKCSVSLFIFSVLYFFTVTSLLSAFGDGVMTGRYDNYIYDESGLFSVIKAVLQNPLYAVQQSLNENKSEYILQMLLPLMFMPLRAKRASRLILLLPFILVNIMTNYVYQHDIYYQYGFGSGAILIYLSVINYGDIEGERKKLLLCAVLCSIMVFLGTFGGRLNYWGYYEQSAEQREIIDTALELVPNDVSVSCCTFLLPNLYYVKELYQLETTERKTEYYVADFRIKSDQYCAADFTGEEFETVFYAEGVVGVFRRT